ncbi:chemotaxis protein CheX [Pseudogracilibacillus sp. SE30717A]|uniref:chemotaxis protein CheX n=1 Tax=Pseudogracilibacillus sp. SE30717A TaxID=3098293 RepID=UPI00300E6CA1
MTTEQRSSVVTKLLNGTLSSIKSVIPIDYQIEKPKMVKEDLQLFYGVLIGITGDIRGNLVFTGQQSTFGSIGEKMFGMPLEGEMLLSFSGELGNMIAGGISTSISQDGTDINITSPTIMQGNTVLHGHKQALKLTVNFESVGTMNTYLLID